jgi:hypothetical protein
LHPMFATGNKPKSRELLRRAMMQLCWACFVTNLLYIDRRISVCYRVPGGWGRAHTDDVVRMGYDRMR